MEKNVNRSRRSVVKTVGVGTAGGLAALAGCLGREDSEPGDWTIGTSGEETATHASGVAFSSTVSEQSDNIEMSAQTTGGTTANNRLIDEGQIDIAQSTHNLLWRANQGREPYTDPEIEKTICQTFSYMTLDIFLVKRDIDDLSDVSTIADLPRDGSVDLSFGPRGTSAYDAASDGMSILGINEDEAFNMNAMGLGDQASAMNEGRLDVCTVYTANQETLIGWIEQLDAQTEIDVLEWDISQSEAQEAEEPVAVSDVSGDVWNQDVSSNTFTALPLGYMTAIPAEIDNDLVYEYVEILMDNNEEVRGASAVLAQHGPDFATEWLQPNGVPVHPGAEEYYRDNDMWDDELTSLDDFE